MTVYLAAISRVGPDPPALDAAGLADFLPLAPAAIERRTLGPCALLVYRWGACHDRPIDDRHENSAVIVGNPIFPEGHGTASVFLDDLASLNQRMRGGYSGVVVRPGRIGSFASLSADYPLFVRETGDLVLFSNRFALLLGVGPEPGLDHAALGSIASNGYAFGPGTTHRGVRRIGPGGVGVATPGGCAVTTPDLSGLFEPIEPATAMPMIRAGVASATAELAAVDPGVGGSLPLSGGKDSRAIAGMLHAAGVLDRFAVFTNGALYAPDVLAAADVARWLGVPHEVRRPPLITSGVNILDRISATLLALQGQVSLFDHAGTGRSGTVSIGGHQVGLRETWFRGDPPRSGDAERIAEGFSREVLLDGQGLLRPDAAEEVRRERVAVCRDLLERGVPVGKTPLAFMWTVRMGGWLSIVNGSANVASSTINPLLNIDLMRLAFGLPGDIVASEVIHFLIMQSTAPGLADIPFADQCWGPGLGPALGRLGSGVPAPGPTPEYRSSPLQPDASNPFLPNVKLAAYKVMSRFVAANADGLGLPWLDVPAVKIVCRPDAPSTLSRGISQGGAFTGVLWAKYGRDLVRRSFQDRIKEDLAPFVCEDDTPPTPTADDRTRLLQKSLAEHEAAIGRFIAAERASRAGPREGDAASTRAGRLRSRLKSAAAAARGKPVRAGLWHVEIVNGSVDPVEIWFDFGLGRASPRVGIGPGAIYSYGLRETGLFRLRASSAAGMDETHRLEVRAERATYIVRLGGAGAAAPRDGGPGTPAAGPVRAGDGRGSAR